MSLTPSEIRALADRKWSVLPGTQDETVSELRVLQRRRRFLRWPRRNHVRRPRIPVLPRKRVLPYPRKGRKRA